jgi:hypothetical protein
MLGFSASSLSLILRKATKRCYCKGIGL